MPIVQVNMWKGISDDFAKKIIIGITKVFVDLGIPLKVVEVIIQEIPKSRWGIDGKPATESRPDEGPPQ